MSALKKGGSGLMEVDEEKNKIRRCPTLPLPEWNDARREELMNNTVYVKGDYRFWKYTNNGFGIFLFIWPKKEFVN